MKRTGKASLLVVSILLVYMSAGYQFMLPCAFADDFILVCNKGLAVTSLSKADLKKIYNGKKTKWDNNEKITFVIHSNTAVHSSFLKTVLGKSSSQFKSYWKRMVFSGKGKNPKKLKNDEEVLGFVNSTPGSLGYVSAGAGTDAVKTISVP